MTVLFSTVHTHKVCLALEGFVDSKTRFQKWLSDTVIKGRFSKCPKKAFYSEKNVVI